MGGNRKMARKRPDVRRPGSGVFAKTHGMKRTPEYQAWSSMITRCENKNRPCWADYGGRGITICDRWRNSFEHFYNDMGKRPSPKHTVERENNKGNYEPGNCKWGTRLEQNANRRSSHFVEIDGHGKVCLAEAARITGIPYVTILSRYRKGHDILTRRRR